MQERGTLGIGGYKMDEKLINSAKEYLIQKYKCHSIILYGSFLKLPHF